MTSGGFLVGFASPGAGASAVSGILSRYCISASRLSLYVSWRQRFQSHSGVQKPLWSGSSMASESQMKRMPGPVCAAPQALRCRANVCRSVNSTAVPAYDAFCSAPVRCGKSACPGAGLDD